MNEASHSSHLPCLHVTPRKPYEKGQDEKQLSMVWRATLYIYIKLCTYTQFPKFFLQIYFSFTYFHLPRCRVVVICFVLRLKIFYEKKKQQSVQFGSRPASPATNGLYPKAPDLNFSFTQTRKFLYFFNATDIFFFL